MKQIKIAELVLDFSLYPRTQIDSSHVRYMIIANKGGAKFPPIVIDKHSKRVIDGFHRVTMYKRIDKDAMVDVIEKAYASEKEMFADSVRWNSNHGRNLSPYDRTHCILRAEEIGLTVEEIASSLSMTVEAIGEMRAEKVGKLRVAGKSTEIPLKRTISHMSGKSLTTRQYEANDRLGGMNQMFYVNQLVELLEADLIDWDNEEMADKLRHLGDLINSALKTMAA